MKEKPLISVIIPAFNEEETIGRAVRALTAQTYENIEILIIDDGSTDRTEIICLEFAQKDSRIHLIKKENGGLSSARNQGVRSAKGNYIAFLDADDDCRPDYIKRMYEALMRDGSDLCICGYYSAWPGKKRAVTHREIDEKHVKYSRKEAEAALIKGYIGYHAWGKLYRAEMLKQISYPIGKTYEDIYTFPGILDRCKNITVIRDRLVMYIQRENSIVHRQEIESEYCAFDAGLRVLNKYIRKYPQLTAYLLREPVSTALRLKIRCLLSKENRGRIEYARIRKFLKLAKRKKASYVLLNCKYRAALLLLG